LTLTETESLSVLQRHLTAEFATTLFLSHSGPNFRERPFVPYASPPIEFPMPKLSRQTEGFLRAKRIERWQINFETMRHCGFVGLGRL